MVPAEAEFCAGSLQIHVSRAGGLEGSDVAVPFAFHPCPGRTGWLNTPRISRLARRSSGGLAALHRYLCEPLPDRARTDLQKSLGAGALVDDVSGLCVEGPIEIHYRHRGSAEERCDELAEFFG